MNQLKRADLKRGFGRLRTLVDDETPKWKQDGMTAGFKWACETASPLQLRRLQTLMRDIEYWEGTATVTTERFIMFLADNVGWDLRVDETLVVTISEDESCDEATEFWAPHLGDDSDAWPRPAFVLGFVKGALSFWELFTEDQLLNTLDDSGC